MIIKVCISHPKFQGFTRYVHSSEFASMQDIFAYMKRQLMAYLESENLTTLVSDTQELKLHCPEYDFYAELVSSQADIIYICHDYT